VTRPFRPPAYIGSAAAGEIFFMGELSENREKSKFRLKWTEISGNFHEEQVRFIVAGHVKSP
jgi:hypothetical protein